MRDMLIAFIGIVTLLLSGCGRTPPVAPRDGSGQRILAKLTTEVFSARIVSVTLTITGEGIAQPIIQTQAVSGQGRIFSFSVDVPVGEQRTFVLEATDASGDTLYTGSQTVKIVAGATPDIVVLMEPTFFVLLVTPSDTTVTTGASFPVAVDVYNVQEMFGASFELTYDSNLIVAIDASPGTLLGGDALFFEKPEEGRIAVSLVKKRGEPPVTGSGRLATVQFEARRSGTATVTIAREALALQKADGTAVGGMEALIVESGTIVATRPGEVSEEDRIRAQQKAAEAKDAFTQELDRLREMDESDISLVDVDFSMSNTLYKEAIASDPNNTEAQFGAAITELLTLTQNKDAQAVEDSLRAYVEDGDLHKPLGIPMSVESVPRLPKAIYRMAKTAVKEPIRRAAKPTEGEPFTVTRIQRTVSEVIIPAVDYALERLAVVEKDPAFQFIVTPELLGDMDEEPVELDLGEAYAFDAQLRIFKASLLILTAYNFDFDDKGSYGFLEDPTDAELLRHLMRLDQDSDFLTLKSAANMRGAKQDLLTAVGKLETSVAFIRNERDTQQDDLIRQRDIMDLDEEVNLTDNRDAPQFVRNVKSVEDMLAKIREVLSGPVDVDADYDDDEDTPKVMLEVNLSTFFDNPIPDFKKLLPYHRWFPENFENEDIYDDFWLTDRNGNKLSGNDPAFVLPDQTFHGLLPGLRSNQEFLDTFGITPDEDRNIDILDRYPPGRVFLRNETSQTADVELWYVDESGSEVRLRTSVQPGETKEISRGLIKGDTYYAVRVLRADGSAYPGDIYSWIWGNATIVITRIDERSGIGWYFSYEAS